MTKKRTGLRARLHPKRPSLSTKPTPPNDDESTTKATELEIMCDRCMDTGWTPWGECSRCGGD